MYSAEECGLDSLGKKLEEFLSREMTWALRKMIVAWWIAHEGRQEGSKGDVMAGTMDDLTEMSVTTST